MNYYIIRFYNQKGEWFSTVYTISNMVRKEIKAHKSNFGVISYNVFYGEIDVTKDYNIY